MRRTLAALATALVAVAFGSAYTAAARPAASAKASASAARIGTRHTSLGTILVDARGRTLYRFGKDTGSRSHCSGACAQGWPPALTTGRPRAGHGVHASKLGTTRRADGTRQVTYAGHPLYTYIADSGPGDTFGQGSLAFGARWYVVAPSGRRITR